MSVHCAFDDAGSRAYWDRVWALVEGPRQMSQNAARTVVSAAMYGYGCLEGTMRAKIEAEGKGSQ